MQRNLPRAGAALLRRLCKGAVSDLSYCHCSDFPLDCMQELRFNPAHANTRLVRLNAAKREPPQESVLALHSVKQ
jgi:hypothetical protein